MRLSLPAYLVLNLAALRVVGGFLIYSRTCRWRLRRADRLFDAGRIAEGERTLRAVNRSIVAFHRRHPRWGLDRVGEAA